MPATSNVIPAAREKSAKTSKGGATFTGDVYLELAHKFDGGVVANVNFTPSARTFWHTHEKGQLLHVLAGSGWVCDRGGQPRRINVGDVVWCEPGVEHWHGADDGTHMTHLAVAHGETKWLEEVSKDQYGKKASA